MTAPEEVAAVVTDDGRGVSIHRRGDGAFVLRTWRENGHDVSADRPVYLSKDELTLLLAGTAAYLEARP